MTRRLRMQTLLNLELQHRWSLGHGRRDSWTLLTLRHTPLQTLMLMLGGGLLRVLVFLSGTSPWTIRGYGYKKVWKSQ